MNIIFNIHLTANPRIRYDQLMAVIVKILRLAFVVLVSGIHIGFNACHEKFGPGGKSVRPDQFWRPKVVRSDRI